MTDWDRHYTRGTLRPSKPTEDYYPQTDWGWRIVYVIALVMALAFAGTELANRYGAAWAS